MALRKSYAGKVIQQVTETVLEDGSVVKESKQVCEPTRHVDMHPFEEAATLAHWAINEIRMRFPRKPSPQDEHEWLIEHDAEYIKQKRAQWKEAYDAIQPELEEAQGKFQALHDIWNLHAERAYANGFDPDTYPDGRKLPAVKKK